MGHCAALDLQMVGCAQTARTSPELKASVENLVKLAEKQADLSPSENKHVQAVKLYSEGSVSCCALVYLQAEWGGGVVGCLLA